MHRCPYFSKIFLMERVITKALGKDKYFCPNCATIVDYRAERKRVSLHDLPRSPGTRCPATKWDLELRLDPNAPVPGIMQVQSTHVVEEAPKKKAYQRRANQPGDPQNRRPQWRDDYAIKCEGSWGNDDLGQEGGMSSVRARSGGRVESRRSKY